MLALLGADMLMVSLRYRIVDNPFPDNPLLSLAAIQKPGAMPAVLYLVAVVCLRSCIGLALHFPWKRVWHWGVILTLCVALGKTLGGFAADHFEPEWTGLLSLGAATLLFLLTSVPVAGILGVLLFT